MNPAILSQAWAEFADWATESHSKSDAVTAGSDGRVVADPRLCGAKWRPAGHDALDVSRRRFPAHEPQAYEDEQEGKSVL